jgi:hypothetical protein
VATSTVEKDCVRSRRPSSPAWRSSLKTHLTELVSIDFFTVPTVVFKVLFVLIVLAHDRRKVLHFNVTAHPTTQWAAQQLVEAFPSERNRLQREKAGSGVGSSCLEQGGTAARAHAFGLARVARGPAR